MSPTRQQLLATTDAFFQHYHPFSKAQLLSVCSPTFIYTPLPQSRGRPQLDRTQWKAFMDRVIDLCQGMQVKKVLDDDSETMVDVEKRNVLLHVRSNADTPVGPYSNEYHFVLTMSEDGDAVDELVEFVDSAYTAGWYEKMGLSSIS